MLDTVLLQQAYQSYPLVTSMDTKINCMYKN